MIVINASLQPSSESTEPPEDLQTARALIAELTQKVNSQEHKLQLQDRTIQAQSATIDSHECTIAELQQHKQELELTVAELLQRAFRNRSERYLNNPRQLQLDFQNTDEAADAAEGLAAALEEAEQSLRRRRPSRPPNRRNEQLPEHLPRYEVEIEVPEDERVCETHGPKKLIGYDTTETLEFERPKLRVRVTKYPKYACAEEPSCGVVSPERQIGLVEGHRYDTSVAAEIITGKYAYHLPVYREQDYFAGSGWAPSRSTLLNILVAAAAAIRPLIACFRDWVLESGKIGTDETRTTLLLLETIPKPENGDPKSQRIYEVFSKAWADGEPSVSGRMWAYRSLTVPLTVFDFTVSRHRDGPDFFLKGFQGTLLAECYAGYQQIELRTDGSIQRAACVADARRKVYDARENYPKEASWLLARFQQLYDVEDRAKGLISEDRVQLRQSEALRIWKTLGDWLEGSQAREILPKSKLGQALLYLRNHWDPLQVYLSDGMLPIDNNEVAQLMKQVAIGRKNWLFVGSVAAGERAADFLSLISSALRNDLDVSAYVKDVLVHLR